jgi:opacity protein-like surface antigen
MDRLALRSANISFFIATLGCSLSALAQEPLAAAPPAAPAAAAPPPEPAAAKPKPPPYSLPWQLRPAVVGNVVRSDTSFAFYKDAAGKEKGSTVASMLLATYKITDEFAPLVRVGMVSNSPPSSLMANMQPVDSAANFLNPVIGGTYAIKPAKPLRLAFFLGVTLPIGGGGGDEAKVENKTANAMGIRARSAMDNAMFSVNDFTIFPGVGLAYVSGGFTAQIEATLLQLTRVKGDKKNAMGVANNPDKSKTNFTMGLHVGYFLTKWLSVGTEIRHQRFLSTPKAVEDDEASMTPLGLRHTTTVAAGPRFHFKLSESIWFRPGVSYAMGIDNPLEKFEYKIWQLDLPLAF